MPRHGAPTGTRGPRRPLARRLPPTALLLLATALLAAFPAGGEEPLAWPLELPGVLLFETAGRDAEPGLWRTDGSREGTRPLPDACLPGSSGTNPAAHAGTRIFYVAHCGPAADLWVTDGDAAGTRRLTSLAATRRVSTFPAHHAYVPSLGRHFFVVLTNNVEAAELWVSDGTAAGTRPLAPLPPGDGAVGSLAAVPGALLVQLQDPAAPQPRWRLWRSDGTAAGTVPLGDLAPPGAAIGALHEVGGRAVYSRLDDDRLLVFASDGSGVPAAPIATLEDAERRHQGTPAFRRHGDLLYFTAFDTLHDLELWATDGTAAGTVRLTDVEEALPFDTTLSGAPPELRPAGGALYFAAFSEAGGREPWRTDGTAAGTFPLGDLCPGPCSTWPRQFAPFDGAVYFLGGDPEGETTEIWRHEAGGGSLRLAVLPRQAFAFPPLRLLAAGGRLFLFGPAPGTLNDQQVWRLESDGALTPLTAFRLPEALGSLLVTFTAFDTPLGERLFFFADDGLHGFEPWLSDGTPEGTALLADLSPLGTGSGTPPAPRALRPGTIGPDSVNLQWTAPGGYVHQVHGLAEVQARSPSADWHTVAWADHAALGATVGGLDAGVPYAFRVRYVNAGGPGPWSVPTGATPMASAAFATPCVPGDATLCFADGRFTATVAWRNQHGGGESGSGKVAAAPAGGRSGSFWFFRPDNVELIVKLLDGRPVNGDWWVFYGALSDVEYWLTVVDHVDHRGHTYYNPPGEVCGRGDTRPWVYSPLDPPGSAAAAPRLTSAPGGVSAWGVEVFDAAPAPLAPAAGAAHPPVPCAEDGETLCLLGGRFQVRVAWEDQYNGGSGVGGALPFTDRSGFFWFFRPDNVELVVKVLDGRAINGKVWFFYGALSDVGYTIDVLDLADGHAGRRYVNPPGNLCGRADTTAF